MTAQNSALLKLNLEKNKVYRLKSTTEQTVTQTVNGTQQNVVTNANYAMSMKMIDLTKDFMVTEIHLDTIITNTNTMGRSVIISSAAGGDIKSSETGSILSYVMNSLSKNALYVKIDFTGKPVEIINQKMLSDLILKDTSSMTLSGPTASAVKKQVTGSISDDNLKKMISTFMITLPAKEIKKGESWNFAEQINSGGMLLSINTTYRLDEVKDNLAKVNSESIIKAVENAAPIQSGGATVTYDNLQGLSKSNIVIDIRTGLIIDSETKNHITGNLGVSAPGVSMQIPLDINGESKIKTQQ